MKLFLFNMSVHIEKEKLVYTAGYSMSRKWQKISHYLWGKRNSWCGKCYDNLGGPWLISRRNANDAVRTSVGFTGGTKKEAAEVK